MHHDLEIRPAVADDLPLLVASLGQPRFFSDRLVRQEQDKGVLLAAFIDQLPVGVVYVWWEQAEEPEIRERLAGVPLLNHLEVREDRRNRRIGTALLHEAERLLRDRGHTRVALGVNLDNHHVSRLYRRLGYARWPYPDIETTSEYVGTDGQLARRTEMCRIYVKELV